MFKFAVANVVEIATDLNRSLKTTVKILITDMSEPFSEISQIKNLSAPGITLRLLIRALP